jgi:hypothetical protein
MPRQNAEQGLACLREMGFAVRSFYDADAKFQRFAGADAARAASMMQAAQDADTGILLALRGGYGLSRLMHLVDWDAFAAAGKTCVGYSDFTLCHQQLLRRGVPLLADRCCVMTLCVILCITGPCSSLWMCWSMTRIACNSVRMKQSTLEHR